MIERLIELIILKRRGMIFQGKLGSSVIWTKGKQFEFFCYGFVSLQKIQMLDLACMAWIVAFRVFGFNFAPA